MSKATFWVGAVRSSLVDFPRVSSTKTSTLRRCAIPRRDSTTSCNCHLRSRNCNKHVAALGAPIVCPTQRAVHEVSRAKILCTWNCASELLHQGCSSSWLALLVPRDTPQCSKLCGLPVDPPVTPGRTPSPHLVALGMEGLEKGYLDSALLSSRLCGELEWLANLGRYPEPVPPQGRDLPLQSVCLSKVGFRGGLPRVRVRLKVPFSV
jgi:hypothetical protein